MEGQDLERLIRYAADPSPGIRRTGMRALSRRPDGAEPLREAVRRERDPTLLPDACRWLLETRDPERVAICEEHMRRLREPPRDEATADAIARALHEIAGGAGGPGWGPR